MGGREKLLKRFMLKVRKTDTCWLWVGCRTAGGYGRIMMHGCTPNVQFAHRVSYELFVGSIPDDLLIRHDCDNPQCVNPNHLQVGTYADNGNDMKVRGRACRGERHHSAKLTKEQVLEIQRLYRPYSKEFSCKKLSVLLGVSEMAVHGVVSGKYWKSVERPNAVKHSGTKGVYLYHPNKNWLPKWKAHIGHQGRFINLGTFDTFESALEFRLLAVDMLHGESAKTKGVHLEHVSA